MLASVFSWMPTPIFALTIAAFGVFGLVICAKVFRLILDLLPFV